MTLEPAPTMVAENPPRKSALSLTISFSDSKRSLKRTDSTARVSSKTLIDTEAKWSLKRSLDKY